MMSDEMKDMLAKLLQKRRGKYSEEVRSFALTLHFYSPKAYNYIRKMWGKRILPHPSTIRALYQVVDGSPGFTKEALQAIAVRASEKKIVVNLVIDEMSIKQEVIYNKYSGQYYGGIDFGNFEDAQGNKSCKNDNPIMATNALVFMVVSQNESWKVPIGYFLVGGLNSVERANLLKLALETLHSHNCSVYSVTFDGASSNLRMCEVLGANFEYGSNFKPCFTNPITMEPCYVFLDLCHMIKLIRNTLGDCEIIGTANGEKILWYYIQQLYKLQRDEGITAGNKLTKKHIHYKNNKMNVKLAMQTLSESVSKSLIFVSQLPDKKIQENFSKSAAAAQFCQNFNDMADMLNCKNRFSKQEFNCPLMDSNYSRLKIHAKIFEKYIVNLTDDKGKPILKTQRKTGFLGIIVCLRNIFPLFDKFKSLGLTYLLTYKLSQDYLEKFFSAIRGRNGFNNNPNALQFQTSYKRLLVRHEIKEFQNGNCLFDNVEILHVSSRKDNLKCPIGNPDMLQSTIEFDHDYVSTCFALSTFVEEVVSYISGFVSHKLMSIIDCPICKEQLLGESMPLLSKLKNRGPFVIPSKDVISICKVSERIFRQYSHALLSRNIKTIIVNKIFSQLDIPFDNEIMNKHVLSQKIFDNHRTQLCN
jgi:DNA transposase THAP9